MNATIKTEVARDTLRVTLACEIDHHSAKGIREEIDDLLFAHRPRTLILSLSEVSFMDSSGLGLILGRLTRMEELGGKLILEDPTRQTLKILRLAGLDKKIKVRNTK